MTGPDAEMFAAHQAVTAAILRYATGIDMRDWDLYRRCFTDPVEIDFTSWSGGEPRTLPAAEWVAAVRQGLAGFTATQHTMTNFHVTIDGSTARTLVYIQALHYLPNEQGDSSFTLGGYYNHELRHEASEWLIHKVKLTVTWTQGNRHVFELARARVAAGEAGPRRDY